MLCCRSAQDGTVLLYDVKTENQLLQKSRKQVVDVVAISRDGKNAAVATDFERLYHLNVPFK